MYSLYLDKPEEFTCEVNVKNASTKNSIARLVIETNDVNLVFNGKIDGDKCVIPVKKLKGIIDENTTGKAKLEIILEDTYFVPWESECIIEKYSKVEINEVKNTIINKPSVGVKLISQAPPTPNVPTPNVPTPSKNIITEQKTIIKAALNELNYIVKKLKIKKIGNNDDIRQILTEFFKQNNDFKQYKKYIIKEFFSKKEK